MTLPTLLFLYIAFRIKQYSCDFLFQSDWMALNKGRPGWEGYKALVSHTLSHAAGTFIIMMIFVPALWWMALVDFFVHSVVDRFKGMITYDRKWKYEDRWFWWSFGLDQEAHNFTHLAYVVFIFLNSGGAVF